MVEKGKQVVYMNKMGQKWLKVGDLKRGLVVCILGGAVIDMIIRWMLK